jgi:hypothetical protein
MELAETSALVSLLDPDAALVVDPPGRAININTPKIGDRNADSQKPSQKLRPRCLLTQPTTQLSTRFTMSKAIKKPMCSVPSLKKFKRWLPRRFMHGNADTKRYRCMTPTEHPQ